MADTTMPRRDYGGRTADQRRAERKERLLDAGFELFGSNGYAVTSIEKLCAAASVSTRNFYQEFDGREQVLIELHDRITARAMAAAVEALEAAEDSGLAQRVGAALRAYLEVTSSDPRWTRIAYVENMGVGKAVEEHRIVWRERLCRFFDAEGQRVMDRGEAPRRELRTVSIAFIGAVNETMRDWESNGRPVPLDEVCAELTRILVASVVSG
ncbi:TetR/AcrR family transcriptional regulator [Sciscionella marina]|uniref:TetR/AcrR family transcriptional regulator n=1 Tax=Sciscionella marina TaxID=508770 RepID=UPI00038225E6|nr:TetR/AcrR family transcriptional regulator [Sciscionella marina]